MRRPIPALVLAGLALAGVTGCTSNDGRTEDVPGGRNGSPEPGTPGPGLPTNPAVVPTTTAGPTQSAGRSVGPTTTPGFDGSDRGSGGG